MTYVPPSAEELARRGLDPNGKPLPKPEPKEEPKAKAKAKPKPKE